MRSEDFYKKLIQRVKAGVRTARIPCSFSKKKNNVFSNEQHIVIQVLRQLEGKVVGRKGTTKHAIVSHALER